MARARIVKHGESRQLDARELVEAQAEAVTEHLRRSLLDGVSPVDGSPRPRKANGKPLGVDTGELARSLRVGRETGTQGRARVSVTAPESRAAFLDRHPDVLTLDGRADEVCREAATEYLREINGHE